MVSRAQCQIFRMVGYSFTIKEKWSVDDGPGVHLQQGPGCLRSELLVACQPGKNRNSGLEYNL